MRKEAPDQIDDLLEKVRWHIQARKYRLSRHCLERQKQRSINLPHILFVLTHGVHESNKTVYKREFQTWNYAIRGKTLDGESIRVIVAFERDMVIITAIRLARRKK